MKRNVRYGAGVAFAALVLFGCDNSDKGPPAVDVSAVIAASASHPLHLTYTARVRGEREVEVRARVSGILEHRYYREGETVEAGARLFRIDPKPFEAAARSAQGKLGVESARLQEAERQRERVNSLFSSGFVSGRSKDLAESEYAGAKAAVAAARADLEKAKLDLSYTDVRAPIGGITGLESRSEGSLVDATDQTSSLLTTITQTASLHVDFTMPETEAQNVRAAMKDGPVNVRLLAAGSNTVLAAAPITFVDTRIDADTGTVNIRASIENNTARLLPGQFVRAEVAGIKTPVGIYIPGRAVLHGAEGPFVWKIDQKNLAQMQPVVLGAPTGNLMHIKSGIAAGDRVVTEGILKLQPNTPVRTATAEVPEKKTTATK